MAWTARGSCTVAMTRSRPDWVVQTSLDEVLEFCYLAPDPAMKSIYISSTRADLQDHLQPVAETLRQCGYDVESMEKYPSRDNRPKAASEADVAKSDVYVGIFAWRYGYVPDEDNPERKSITELEYLAAERAQRARLVFLLDDDAPWPSSRRDAEQEEDGGKRIRDLRNRLKKERWTAFFKSPDDLARQVLISILQTESTHQVAGLDVLKELQTAAEFGPSFLTNLQGRFAELSSTPFIALRLGPTPWWNTRLHLASALASDFTEIRQFVILDSARSVLAVASPLEIRRALSKSQPKLEMAYLQCRDQARPPFPTNEIDFIISLYPGAVMSVFGGQVETQAKEVITPAGLRELGIKQEGEVLEQFAPENRPFSYADIMRRRKQYVVLMRNGEIEGVVDRAELATRIAGSQL
jgi:hypothetical protein